MLEELKITSQQTIFAVLKESILIFLSSANVMCNKIHCSVHLLHPQQHFLAFRSSWHFYWVYTGLTRAQDDIMINDCFHFHSYVINLLFSSNLAGTLG